MLFDTSSDYVLLLFDLLLEIEVSGTGEVTNGSAEVFSGRKYHTNLQ